MCVLLMPQFILFFASFGEDYDKGRCKLETIVETRGNATEPCSAPRSPRLSLPSSSLHDPCTGLLPQKSLSRGKSVELHGRKLLGLVAFKFFQERQISLERSRT